MNSEFSFSMQLVECNNYMYIYMYMYMYPGSWRGTVTQELKIVIGLKTTCPHIHCLVDMLLVTLSEIHVC